MPDVLEPCRRLEEGCVWSRVDAGARGEGEVGEVRVGLCGVFQAIVSSWLLL